MHREIGYLDADVADALARRHATVLVVTTIAALAPSLRRWRNDPVPEAAVV